MNSLELTKRRVMGRYKLTVSKAETGIIVKETPWFDNLITDGGLDRMGNNADWLTNCQVGSGNTAPANNNTTLASFIANSSTLNGTPTRTNAQDGSDWYCSISKVFRFAAGVATGNIAEVGVGWSATSGSLFSRALVTPSAITVLADEVLDVTYEFRYYAPSADANGMVTLNSVNYYWLARACEVDNNTYWTIATNNGVNQGNGPASTTYSGQIGAITVSPSSASGSAGTNSVNTYVSNPPIYERSCVVTWGLSAGNAAGGIGAIRFGMGIGTFQIGFYEADLTTPKPIPKNNTNTLSLTFKHSWARRP